MVECKRKIKRKIFSEWNTGAAGFSKNKRNSILAFATKQGNNLVSICEYSEKCYTNAAIYYWEEYTNANGGNSG